MAKIVLKTSDLKSGMQKTSKIAGSSANLDSLRAYYFFVTDGKLQLASSDLKLTLFAPLRATLHGEVPVFALDCKFLDDFVKCAEDEVTIEVHERHVLLFTGNSEVRAPIKAHELFESQITADDWQETWDGGETAYMLSALLSVSNKTHALNEGDDSILLDGERAFCFDGSNIALVPFKTTNKYVITNSIAKQLLLLISSGKVHIKVIDDETLVVVKTDEDLFSFRNPIYENRISFDQLLDSLQEQLVMAFPKQRLVRALQRCLLTKAKEFRCAIQLEGTPKISFNAYDSNEETKDFLPISQHKYVSGARNLEFVGNLEDFALMVSSVPQEVVRCHLYTNDMGTHLVLLQDELKKFRGYLGVEVM